MSYLGSSGYNAMIPTAQASYSSGLEHIAFYAAAEPVSREPIPFLNTVSRLEYEAGDHKYTSSQQTLYETRQASHKEYVFQPDNFLLPGIVQPFIGEAEDIREFVEEAFLVTVGQPFPEDLSIRVCDEKEFHKLAPDARVIGFSINRKELGAPSEIVVKSGSLGRVMLTVGHEIGHVMTKTLFDKHNEEAKAFSFSFAWMKAIKENNIANLEDVIVIENPADNGLHDVAHRFVVTLMQRGKDAIDVFTSLIRGEIEVKI